MSKKNRKQSKKALNRANDNLVRHALVPGNDPAFGVEFATQLDALHAGVWLCDPLRGKFAEYHLRTHPETVDLAMSNSCLFLNHWTTSGSEAVRKLLNEDPELITVAATEVLWCSAALHYDVTLLPPLPTAQQVAAVSEDLAMLTAALSAFRQSGLYARAAAQGFEHGCDHMDAA